MQIGGVELDGDALLAPLAGFTDVGFRALAKKYGAALTYTEMVSAKGLVYDNDKTRELLVTHPSETPCAVQLFGSDAEYMGKACAHRDLFKFDIIDINMGCPVPKIVKNGDGSALLKDVDRAESVVAAAVKHAGGRPVTVKMRIGFREGEDIAVPFARAIERGGASAVTVHGRTREQYYTGRADRGAIARVARALSIPVIANGDVTDAESYADMKRETGAAGVMIGRGALGRPYIFSLIRGVTPKVSLRDDILEQIDVVSRYYGERYVYNTMKRHICYYAKGMRGNNKLKEEVFAVESVNALRDIIKRYFT